MPARAYLLAPDLALTRTHLTGPTLDAISLDLPEGVYTTMRTYRRDYILGLSAHLQRIIDSLDAMGQPHPIDLPAVRAALREVIERENTDALRLRITTPFAGRDIFISVEPFASYPADFYTHGVRCATSPLERRVPVAKHTSFIGPSRSARAEVDPAIHEMLMVNQAGEILEGFSSNFFAVMDGRLYTAGAGVLEGVTRNIILAGARAVVPVSLKPVRVADLARVSEAFLTSSGREVMPVRQIDAALIGDPGPVTKQLRVRYHEQVMRAAELP